jgi:hypothetical protein
MIYAQIVSGKVHGVFEYDPLPEFAPNIVMVPLEGGSPVAAGWLYDGSVFTAPPAPGQVVPTSVKMRAAKLALIDAGLLSTVDAAIAAMTGVEGEKARVEWTQSETLRRDHPLLAQLGPALGLTDAQIDGLFMAAAVIQ